MRKRKNHRFTSKNSNKTPQKANDQDDEPRKPYEDIVRENDAFVTYYKTQNICDPAEWDTFLETIKSDLPTTFRITANKDEALAMLKLVEGEFLRDILAQDGSESGSHLFPLPWYPDKMAWQLSLSRKDIRRDERYYKLHNFLISETDNGTISRQETVSMIPPLVLDVQSHHKVLDMCAAPGSKTAQLIELLHKTEDDLPSGFVVANDVDNKRCYMLVHQAKRLNSPCIAIMNHDAAILPNLKDASGKNLEFDRILCDVPCSGDGTLRKNPDIWMKWTPANGLNQHGVQTRVVRRAAELLAIGGRLVYSTCSLNPVENEAVIHRLLVETNGALRLLDVTKDLPGLKYAQGMEKWKVGSRNLEFYDRWEDVDEKWQTTIRPQMFPPKEEDRDTFGLKKCVRILPQMQDTGAFFVAVLEKTRAVEGKYPEKEWRNAAVQKQDEAKGEKTEAAGKESEETGRESEDKGCAMEGLSTEDEAAQENPEKDQKAPTEDRAKPFKEPPSKKRKRPDPEPQRRGYKEDPFVFFGPDEAVWPSIKDFYSVSDRFDPQCLLTRCNVGKKKNIYYTCAQVKDLIVHNKDRVKFINTGVKAFVRSDNRHMKCAFRLANEGLESILAVVGPQRRLEASKKDLIRLLSTTDAVPFEELEQEFRESAQRLSAGSCVLAFKEEGLQLNLVGWRGVTSFRCYISQNNAVHLLRLLGGDISKFDVNKFKKLAND